MDTDSNKTSRAPRILSIDDDKRIQKIIETYLIKKGYEVEFAASGEEGLAKLEKNLPDIILLDVMMEGMDGYEVCEKIQENPDTAYIPVIFATALGEERDRARAFNVGAADYLVKPFRKDELIDKVNTLLKTRDHWNELLKIKETSMADLEETYHFKNFVPFLCKQLGLEKSASDKLAGVRPQKIYDECTKLEIQSSNVAQLIAEFMKVPYLSQINPMDVKLGALPTRFCKLNSVVSLVDPKAGTAFVMSNPFDLHLHDIIKTFSDKGQSFRLMITEPDNIRKLCEKVEDDTPDWTKMRDDVAIEAPGTSGSVVALKIEESEAGEESIEALQKSASMAPIVMLVNEMLAKAINTNASDLHIEPRQTSVGIRYRIDGMLVEKDPIPKKLGPAVISRFKIMASMDITNRLVPQDGHMRFSYRGRHVDTRISTLPSRYGEKIVVRFLDTSAMSLDFESLGFTGASLAIFKDSIKKPNGIILVTGPTGSGKTTTLYSALQALNDPDKNIVTVEDPIEYEMHRINQVQVRPEVKLTFPVALRSILRQDPDIIMVGEMRDLETADIAIKASLTGHLVFSTLHTNDAPSTIIRLVDMGVVPYLIASSVELILAQRLVRRLCPKCKQPATVPEGILNKFKDFVRSETHFFQTGSCEYCNFTGFKGRLGVFEIMPIDKDLRSIIARSPDLAAIQSYAMNNLNMITLQQDAFIKASEGLTSLDEVMRVTG